MTTFNDLLNKANEFKSRVGRFSIGKGDFFGFMTDVVNKQKELADRQAADLLGSVDLSGTPATYPALALGWWKIKSNVASVDGGDLNGIEVKAGGQLVCDGVVFSYVEDPQLVDLEDKIVQTENNSVDKLSVIAKIFDQYKTDPVMWAYSTATAGAVGSTFSGWRNKFIFQDNPFRVVAIKTRCSKANHRIDGYIYNSSEKIIATATAYTTLVDTEETLLFIFNNEITLELLGGNDRFWFGYRSSDNTAVVMDADNNLVGSSNGIYDITHITQYSNVGSSDWVNSSSYRAWWIRFYSSQDVKDLSGEIDKYFIKKTSYDSYTSEITPDSSSPNTYSSPFTGWGENLNVVQGVSFNAIRLQSIRRHGITEELDKWSFVKFFVKNSKDDVAFLAVSDFITIDNNSDITSEIIGALIDPVTGDFKTLSDSDFSGGTYFVGYLIYNKNLDRAFGGNALGDMPNFTGESYYTTATSENHTAWTDYSGNPSIAFEHLLLSGQKLALTTNDIIELQNKVEVLSDSEIRIILPDKYDVTVGDRFQLFFRGVIESPDIYGHYIQVVTTKGHTYARYWEFDSVEADIGTHNLTINVYDPAKNLLGTASTQIVVSKAVTQPAAQKNILCVGDSLTSSGTWCQEIYRRLTASDGNPIGNGFGNIKFIGSRGTAPMQWTGYGGKTWGWYNVETPSGELDFWIYGTHDKDASDQLSYWNDSNGNSWRLEEIEANRLKFSHQGHTVEMPSGSGVLTHSSNAIHTGVINYDSIQADEANPFWDEAASKVDFQSFCLRNGFSGIDVVYTLLTWNGMGADRYIPELHSGLRTDALMFVDNLHADYPSAKIKILGIPIPSPFGGLSTNYPSSYYGSYANYFGLVRTVMGLNLLYQKIANDPAYSDFVEFINVSGQFDAEYNYPETVRVVNTRTNVTERMQTNGVHPDTNGYYQIGDTAYRNFIKNYCQ